MKTSYSMTKRGDGKGSVVIGGGEASNCGFIVFTAFNFSLCSIVVFNLLLCSIFLF